MFRILGSVDALNEKMGVNLTHLDINWVYNCQHLKGQRYYLKTRVPEVRLISCLPDTNKVMDKDFLIVSREWHNGLHCPTWDKKLGGVLRFRLIVLTHLSLTPFFFLLLLFLWFAIFFFLMISHSNNIFSLGKLADKHFTTPNFNLVNESELTRIL